MNYEQDLKIDELALDREWLLQSSKYFQYAKLQAEADAEMRRAKETFEIIKAKLYNKIRIEKETLSLKVTDSIMDAAIKDSDEYKDYLLKYQEAHNKYQILSAAVKAFEQRKYALENLVKLHLAGYFSDPKVQQEGDIMFNKDFAIEQAAKRQTESLAKSLKV